MVAEGGLAGEGGVRRVFLVRVVVLEELGGGWVHAGLALEGERGLWHLAMAAAAAPAFELGCVGGTLAAVLALFHTDEDESRCYQEDDDDD